MPLVALPAASEKGTLLTRTGTARPERKSRKDPEQDPET